MVRNTATDRRRRGAVVAHVADPGASARRRASGNARWASGFPAGRSTPVACQITGCRRRHPGYFPLSPSFVHKHGAGSQLADVWTERAPPRSPFSGTALEI